MLLRSLLLGLLAALAALVITNLFQSGGVRVNTDAWPAEARAILTERPGEAITIQQWRRIDKALVEAGNNASPSHLVAAEIRRGWLVVLLASCLALICVRYWLKYKSAGAALAAVAPSALLMLLAAVHSHSYYG